MHAMEMAYLYLAMCLQCYSLLNVRGLHSTSSVFLMDQSAFQMS